MEKTEFLENRLTDMLKKCYKHSKDFSALKSKKINYYKIRYTGGITFMRQGSKILDCTIRDGGLINNWDFSVEFVQDLYNGLSAAGVEYMEIGYKNSPKLLNATEPNPWRFLDDNFLERNFS